MDMPRGPSVALPSPNTESHFVIRRRSSNSQTTSSSEGPRPRKAMAIPGSYIQDIPPALPPPRYNEELANGDDIAWRWGNSDTFGGNTRTLAPIKPGSSLLGGRQEPHTPLLPPDEDGEEEDDGTQDMELDEPMDRRSSTLTIRSPSHSEISSGSHVPHLVRRPLSPSGTGQRLHGEKPLAQQNHHQSTHAYDQRLLSKIGKSNSPPQHSRSNSSDNPLLGHKLSVQTRDPTLVRRPTNEPSSAVEPLTKWMTSPTSGALSPGSKPSWRDLSTDHRSPASIDSAANSVALDPELFLGARSAARQPQNGPVSSPEAGCCRSHRNSHDSAVYAGDAASMNEDSSLRGMQYGDRDARDSRQGQGMKRRALSPPSEAYRDSRPDQFQRINTNFYGQSPTSHYQPKHGSFSSTGSRQNSLASSATFSAAPSSMTSMSSIDTHSPMDFTQTSPHLTSAPPTSSPTVAIMPLRKLQDRSISSKMSLQSAMNDSRMPPSRIGNHFICSCCPKKPKKFETEEQLRAHENEKQYACAYCNNRFKNKNEAERHQNSLHLRKQSWSCAAIGDYQAAFHRSTLSNPQSSASDCCGFCGEEFSNHPQNWDERIDHLTNVHKFGECNSSKKFFRADHFRQHLKHSHAGKSGKWTNMLENRCLREEAPSEPASLSPTASEHSQGGLAGRGPSSLPDPANTSMGGETIDEIREES